MPDYEGKGEAGKLKCRQANANASTHLLQLESLGDVVKGSLFGDRVGLDIVVRNETGRSLVEVGKPLSVAGNDRQGESRQELE